MIMLEHLLFHIFLSHQHKDRIINGRGFHLACDLLINHNISLIKEFENRRIRSKSIFWNIVLANDIKDLPGFNLAEIDEKCVFEIWPQINEKFKNIDENIASTIDENNFKIQNFISIPCFLDLNFENQYKLKMQVRDTIDGAIRDLAEQDKSPGYLPDFLSRQLNTILAECGIDYSSLIKKFATKLKDKKQIKTWNKTNRRYPNKIKGKIISKQVNTKLLIVMDTSGSMWEGKNLDLALGEIKKLSNECKDIWIVGGDVIEQFRFNVVDKKFDFKRFTVTGGGGTDLQFGYVAAKELAVDGVIVLTDGYIPPVNSSNIPSLFVIVPGGISVPGYENIFLL